MPDRGAENCGAGWLNVKRSSKASEKRRLRTSKTSHGRMSEKRHSSSETVASGEKWR